MTPRTFQEELSDELDEMKLRIEEFDAQREIVIKESRDVQKNAKQAICSLQRGDTDKARQLIADSVEAANKLAPLLERGGPALRAVGAYSAALEELAEAELFEHWLEHNTLKPLRLMPLHNVEEYIGGLGDLSGEIGRFAVARATARDVAAVRRVYATDVVILEHLVTMPMGSALKKKLEPLQTAVKKIETILYQLSLTAQKQAGFGRRRLLSPSVRDSPPPPTVLRLGGTDARRDRPLRALQLSSQPLELSSWSPYALDLAAGAPLSGGAAADPHFDDSSAGRLLSDDECPMESLTTGDSLEKDRWLAEWHRRLDEWWLLLPANTAGALQSCAAFLGGVLASRFEMWKAIVLMSSSDRIASPPPALGLGENCEHAVDKVKETLPEFPEPPASFQFWQHLLPIPRLLPERILAGEARPWQASPGTLYVDANGAGASPDGGAAAFVGGALLGSVLLSGLVGGFAMHRWKHRPSRRSQAVSESSIQCAASSSNVYSK